MYAHILHRADAISKINGGDYRGLFCVSLIGYLRCLFTTQGIKASAAACGVFVDLWTGRGNSVKQKVPLMSRLWSFNRLSPVLRIFRKGSVLTWASQEFPVTCLRFELPRLEAKLRSTASLNPLSVWPDKQVFSLSPDKVRGRGKWQEISLWACSFVAFHFWLVWFVQFVENFVVQSASHCIIWKEAK